MRHSRAEKARRGLVGRGREVDASMRAERIGLGKGGRGPQDRH